MDEVSENKSYEVKGEVVEDHVETSPAVPAEAEKPLVKSAEKVKDEGEKVPTEGEKKLADEFRDVEGESKKKIVKVVKKKICPNCGTVLTKVNRDENIYKIDYKCEGCSRGWRREDTE